MKVPKQNLKRCLKPPLPHLSSCPASCAPRGHREQPVMNDTRSREIQLWGAISTLWRQTGSVRRDHQLLLQDLWEAYRAHKHLNNHQLKGTSFIEGVRPKFKHISCMHTRLNTSNLTSATTACTSFITGGQPKLKTARSRRHKNSMGGGLTGIQSEIQAGIKTSNIINGGGGV